MNGDCPLHGAMEQKIDDMKEDVTDIKTNVNLLVAHHHESVGAKKNSFWRAFGYSSGVGVPLVAFVYAVWC